MRYIDLFAGVGGFRYGIEHAWDNQLAKRQIHGVSDNDSPDIIKQFLATKPLCIYSNEWDKNACSVYRRHYNECDQRDIRTVDAGTLPDFDLLCGGFPCQSFSVAGKRGGFDDTRGTLFFEVARIAQKKRPRLLLLENVKGLLSHNRGQTFAVILNTLAELGYDVQWQVLNSKDFGVPQNRERVYIVGHLRGTPQPQVFPVTENDKLFDQKSATNKRQSQTQISATVRRVQNKADDTYIVKNQLKQVGNIDQKGHNSLWGRVYSPDGISSTLNAHGGGLGAKTGLYAMTERRTDEAKAIRREALKNGKDWSPRRGKELVKRNEKMSNCLTANMTVEHLVTDNVIIRRLTPVECERLQGFEDGWTEFDADGKTVSDTQRYKMMGNAVTTKVITAIAERLLYG